MRTSLARLIAKHLSCRQHSNETVFYGSSPTTLAPKLSTLGQAATSGIPSQFHVLADTAASENAHVGARLTLCSLVQWKVGCSSSPMEEEVVVSKAQSGDLAQSY